MNRSPLLVLAAVLATMPTGGAVSSPASGSDDCTMFATHHPAVIPCRLESTVSLDVTGCAADVCAFTATARSDATADLPGVLSMQAYVVGGALDDDGCFGPIPPEVFGEDASCAHLCHVRILGAAATCQGEETGTLELAAGECRVVLFMTHLGYSSVEEADVSFFFIVCRAGDGTPSVRYLS